ncbi:MAG TPA: glycosyltransferase family 4 protein [Acidobacteriota bacterium]|nr:glycosyltransferase family 4 protein [Acidobacteriota bacterium]
MRILYVSQYFPPEMGAPAARVFELAREWRKAGAQVTVLTGFAHHPLGVKAPEDRWRMTRRERVEEIDVVRSYIYAAPNRGVGRRMLSYFSFLMSAVPLGLARCRKPDVVIATSPQLLCACAGYTLARLWRRPFVFEVRDLWPESILAVKAMSDNTIVRSLKRLAHHLYRHCDCIVTVGEGYQKEIHRRYGINLDKMRLVPNGIDPELFHPGPKDNEIRRKFGWGDRFVLLYLGTLGMAHGLHCVLEAAAYLQDDPDKLFVLVGEGAEKEDLKRMADRMKLSNVQFIDQQPKALVPRFYAACDVGLVTLRDTPLFQNVLPSKIFEYLAMERPLLLSVGGQARQLVESSGGGLYVQPDDPIALARAIRKLESRQAELERMGRRGRDFVLAHYNRRDQARGYLELLRDLAAG